MKESSRPRPSPSQYIEVPPRLARRPLMQDCVELDEQAFWTFVESRSYDDTLLLQNYFRNMSEVETVDQAAFLFVLPRALEAWSEALRPADIEAVYATAEFHAALYRKSNILRGIMSASTTARVTQFFVDTLTWFVDTQVSEDSLTLNWLPHWNGATCGIPGLANAWFQVMEGLATKRIAEAYVAYLSRFAYRPSENPLFPYDYDGPEPWTRDVHLTPGLRWTSASLDSARDHLSASTVRGALVRARSHVTHEDMLNLTITDMLSRVDLLTTRAREALENLAAPAPSAYWSDAF